MIDLYHSDYLENLNYFIDKKSWKLFPTHHFVCTRFSNSRSRFHLKIFSENSISPDAFSRIGNDFCLQHFFNSYFATLSKSTGNHFSPTFTRTSKLISVVKHDVPPHRQTERAFGSCENVVESLANEFKRAVWKWWSWWNVYEYGRDVRVMKELLEQMHISLV